MSRVSEARGFRERGGAWVVTQFAVMLLVALGWLVPPDWPAGPSRVLDSTLGIAGPVLAVAGLAVVLWAYRTMGRSFTAMPHPPDDGELVTGGPFRLVRHPVYGGGLVFFTGVSLATRPAALLPVAALAVLWTAKTKVEERWLERLRPGVRRLPPGHAAPAAAVPIRLRR